MRWSEWLVKRSFDESLFDSEPSDTAADKALLAKLRVLCTQQLTTADSIRQLRAELKEITKASTVSDRMSIVLQDVREELREILEDLRFARSWRGRFVLFCIDWAQEVYRTVRLQPRFDDAYVGAHVDREAVVVAGRVPDDAALCDLHAIIDAHPPGVEVIWKVTVGRQG
jgi:hypothetical protein